MELVEFPESDIVVGNAKNLCDCNDPLIISIVLRSNRELITLKY